MPPSPDGDASRHGNRLDASGTVGDVVQARDVQGGVHFHRGEPPFVVTPSQLPGDVSGFVNRHAELAVLDQALARDRPEPLSAVVTVITGTAGVGKTSLALHWAHAVRPEFPDGQLYVNLRGYDPGQPATPEQVLDRFLRDLGVPPPAIPASLPDRTSLYRSLLATRRTLVVLDNAATPGQVRPLLPGNAECLAVVTSRSRLSGLVARDGAIRVDVGVLREDDAVALLGIVTSRYRGHDQRHELVELARLCARLPLALRIAAERAASRPMMRLDELITDLRDESELWETLTPDGDDSDAVRTVFAWSYRALPEAAARLFRLLGLHPGNEFSAEAAAVLGQCDLRTARRNLDALVGAHLIEQPAAGRYEFHDLLRAYANDQARQSEDAQEQAAALERVVTWYLYAADAALHAIAGHDPHPAIEPAPADLLDVAPFATGEAALRWYQTESVNLVAATRVSAAAGLHAVAWRLAVVLGRIYALQNAFDDWLVTGRIGIDAANQDGDLPGQAWAHANLGTAQLQSGQYLAAEASQQASLALRRGLGDQPGEAMSLNALGLVALRSRRLQDAVARFAEAQEHFRALQDERWVALVNSNRAQALIELERLAEAAPLLDAGLEVFMRVEDQFSEGNALFLLSQLRRKTGQIAAARSAVEAALTLAEENDNQMWQAHWLVELGNVQLASNEPGQALESYQHAATIQRRLGDRSREATAIQAAGGAYQALGRAGDAIDFYTVAAATHRDLDDRWRQAQVLASLAAALDQRGDAAAARLRRGEALAGSSAASNACRGTAPAGSRWPRTPGAATRTLRARKRQYRHVATRSPHGV